MAAANTGWTSCVYPYRAVAKRNRYSKEKQLADFGEDYDACARYVAERGGIHPFTGGTADDSRYYEIWVARYRALTPEEEEMRERQRRQNEYGMVIYNAAGGK